jgi:hypothetical protein
LATKVQGEWQLAGRSFRPALFALNQNSNGPMRYLSAMPFTSAQFHALFAAYNAAIWPAQVIAYGAGFGALYAALCGSRHGGRVLAFVLAAMWLWTGLVYHAFFFSQINPAASAFAVLFIAEGAAFLSLALERQAPIFRVGKDAATIGSFGLIALAALIYPALGLASGQAPSALPHFGVTPCPLTLFTFGCLLLLGSAPKARLWSVPVVWSFIGGSAAILLRMPQDMVLLLSGIPALLLAWHRRAGLPVRTAIRATT